MPKASLFKRFTLSCLALVLASASLPATLFADSSTCTPPASNQPGVIRPVGADASTYTYDCTTGLWENGYYSFNPSTGVTTPTYQIVYTYNPSTGMYDTASWVYDAATGQYVSNTESVVVPPAGANVVGAPVVLQVATDPSSGGNSISGTGPNSNNNINNPSGAVDGSSISGTGPSSNNNISGSNTNNANLDNSNNSAVSTLLNSIATSGDANVTGNTLAGSAASGNAQDIANVINLLQSSSNALGGNTETFVANINGDVNGDLVFDPSTLGTVQPTAAPTTVPANNNLSVDNQTNGTINNNINLAASSGNATVADNTTAGDATTGSADAIANVVNLIDSAISSGNSFIGVININGDLNGNIVIPPNLVNQLIASNVPTVSISDTGPSSNNTITAPTNSSNTNVTNTYNEGVNNNVNASSTSGSANVTNNTSAGNATTGDASNNITAFNLTGSNVIGTNDLLVFVNVLGSWVGMILNAPAGATAAELGYGVSSTPSGSSNTNVNNATNEQINNNINANASSGNANVNSNTNAGNATSGNADTAVNLLNVENSSLSLSGWFGILFINVFGTWNGNFGYSPSELASSNGGSSAGTSNVSGQTILAVHFVPKSSSSGSSSDSFVPYTVSGSSSDPSSDLNNDSVSVAAKTKGSTPVPKLQGPSHQYTYIEVAVGLFMVYLVGDFVHERYFG